MNANIDIKKIIKENQAAVLSLSAVLIIIFAYLVVFAPIANKLRFKYMECCSYESRVAGARSIIEMGRKIDKEYGSRVLISEDQAAAGIEELTRYGKSLGINFISIKPQKIKTEDRTRYSILPLELLLEANGEEFVAFVGSIDELKKTIVTVKSFNITPDKMDRKKLKIDMVINIYLSRQGDNPEAV